MMFIKRGVSDLVYAFIGEFDLSAVLASHSNREGD